MIVHKSKIPISTGLECPCCHQMTRRQWDQPTGLPTRPSFTQTDCQNPECASKGTTLEYGVFVERYGSGGAPC